MALDLGSRSARALSATLLMLASCMATAGAQDAPPADPPAPKDCTVDPGGAKAPSAPGAENRSDNLTDTLSDCGSVLEPPPVGDENVDAPPATGDDPAIHPDVLPPAQMPEDAPK